MPCPLKLDVIETRVTFTLSQCAFLFIVCSVCTVTQITESCLGTCRVDSQTQEPTGSQGALAEPASLLGLSRHFVALMKTTAEIFSLVCELASESRFLSSLLAGKSKRSFPDTLMSTALSLPMAEDRTAAQEGLRLLGLWEVT